jgi:hypothetical protein
MAKLPPADYTQLKAFLRAFTDRFMPTGDLAPALRPLALLESMETSAPVRASAGLRMAVNDCVEMTSDWSTERVAALDAELKAEGILTLSQVRQRYASNYAAVLRRGRIKNEIEYHLVHGILVDQAAQLPDEERSRLALMVADYEQHAL